jgi:hypothetical protein
VGHRHHHGEHFDEHFERRWERGPRGFRGFGFGPPPWAFHGPDPRWFGFAPPWMYGRRGWREPEDFGPHSRADRIAMLEEHERRLRHRLERVTEEIRRLREEETRQGGGTTV